MQFDKETAVLIAKAAAASAAVAAVGYGIYRGTKALLADKKPAELNAKAAA